MVKWPIVCPMGRQVNIYEAKTQLSRLVEEAAGGATIIIAKDGKPRAKLIALEGDTAKKEPRKLGQFDEQSKNVDWDKWWRDWKAADKEIEADFEASIAKPFPSAGAKSPRKRRR